MALAASRDRVSSALSENVVKAVCDRLRTLYPSVTHGPDLGPVLAAALKGAVLSGVDQSTLTVNVGKDSVGGKESIPHHVKGLRVIPFVYNDWSFPDIEKHAAKVIVEHVSQVVRAHLPVREADGLRDGGVEIKFAVSARLPGRGKSKSDHHGPTPSAATSASLSVWLLVGIYWTTPQLRRRMEREQLGVEVTLDALASLLTRLTVDLRLHAGLSAKVSREFARTLEDGLRDPAFVVRVPPGFLSYAALLLYYPADARPADILDHALEASTKTALATHPDEFDTHMAVAVLPGLREHVTVCVARLWRAEAQAASVIGDGAPEGALVPFSAGETPTGGDALQREFVSRVSAFRGLRAPGAPPADTGPAAGEAESPWDEALATGLREACVKALAQSGVPWRTAMQLEAPRGSTWLRHTAFVFQRWPVQAMLAFVASHRFWNLPMSALDPGAASFRYALAVVPLPGARARGLLGVERPGAPAGEAASSDDSALVVVAAVAWSERDRTGLAGISHAMSPHRPRHDVDHHDHHHHHLRSLGTDDAFAPTAERRPLDPRMRAEHYGVPAHAVSPSSRDMLWPSHIHGPLYLAGDIPAASARVLAEYGITHVVICDARATPQHPSLFDYLKLASDVGLVAQVQQVVSYVARAVTVDPSAKVLVHDAQGIDHAAALAVGYAISALGLGVREAVFLVTSHRPSVAISRALHAELEAFASAAAEGT